jgi:hypothetical protein
MKFVLEMDLKIEDISESWQFQSMQLDFLNSVPISSNREVNERILEFRNCGFEFAVGTKLRGLYFIFTDNTRLVESCKSNANYSGRSNIDLKI